MKILKIFVCLYIWFRYSTAGSTHTLNNYCDTSDNWTDHDMEIYMTRNATTRNGLVPLWDQLLRCRWYTNTLLKIYNLYEIFWRPVHGEHIITSHQSIETISFIQPPPSTSTNTNNNINNSTATATITTTPAHTIIAHPQLELTTPTLSIDTGECNDLALYLLNRIPAGIHVMHVIETSYLETECCFEYVRTTKTKTNYDPHTINTIEVYRGPRPNQIMNDTINETYI